MSNDWWRGATIYQVYPRSFQDSNGDGVGDLPGLIQRLDYIKSLNVDAIWISPFFASPMKDFGYDVSDYRAVDPIFGSNADFDRLIAEAHARGLKVVIDGVFSHTSDEHPWFAESRRDATNDKADWYVWAWHGYDAQGNKTPPSNWMSVFGGSAWEYDDKRRQYYLHNFHKGQPDLNMHNPDVQQAILDAMEFWLRKGVDGIRLDAANCYFHDETLDDNPLKDGCDGTRYTDYWQLFNVSRPEMIPFIRRMRALTDRYEGRVLMAEVGDDRGLALSKEYTSGPDRLHTAYNFALMHDRINASYIRHIAQYYDSLPGDGWPSWAMSNHDFARAATRLGGPDAPPEKSKQMLLLLSSLRGTAVVYQGEELGLPQAEIPADRIVDPAAKHFGSATASRDGARVPMPWAAGQRHNGFSAAQGDTWLPIPTEYALYTAEAQNRDPGSPLNFARKLFSWRNECREMLNGPVTFYEGLEEPLLAFSRGKGADKTVFIFNMSDRDVPYRLHHYDLIEDLTGQRPHGDGQFLDLVLPACGAWIQGRDGCGMGRDLPAMPGSEWLKADGSPFLRRPQPGERYRHGSDRPVAAPRRAARLPHPAPR